MIIVAEPRQLKKARQTLSNNAKWCYLGKDIAKRDKIEKNLGEGRRRYLKQKLHTIGLSLKEPYIDFVAERGKRQKNALNWWGSKFASKNHMQTDFFTLLSYKVLALDMIKNTDDNNELAIFIEDPWLFSDLMKTQKNEKVFFYGKPNMILRKIFLCIRGILRRIFLLVWLLAARALVLSKHKGKKPKVLENDLQAIGIVNPAEPRTFKNGRYVNNYAPGLVDFYKKKGHKFFYLYPVRFPLSTIKYLGRSKEFLWPLILDVNLFTAIKRICNFWRPKFDKKNKIKGYDISNLLKREIDLEFSSAGFNVHLILFEALNKFFKKKWTETLVYVFENQPAEKMICMAASKNNVTLIGYQHSSISKLFLSQFIAKKEASFVPLPDRIVTTGKYFAKLYENGGIPKEKIVVGGAWRYRNKKNSLDKNFSQNQKSNRKPVVLISLCINMAIAKSMLKNIAKAISINELDKKMEFWVKPHPGNTPYENRHMRKFYAQYKIVTKPFDLLLRGADFVISSASTAGLEALLAGKKVVSYIPENLFTIDPLLDISDEKLYKWHEGEDIDVDFLKDSVTSLNVEDRLKIKKEYFEDVNYEAWLTNTAIQK